MSSPTAYPKAGKHSRIRGSKGDVRPVTNERLTSRLLLSTCCETSPEQRMTGNYAKEPRMPNHQTNPRIKVDGTRSKVTSSGIASRGNVIHGRYLVGM